MRAVQQSDHEVVPAVDYGMDPLLDVHTARYLDFLATAFSEWTRAGLKGRVFPANFDARPQIYKPDWSVVARAGYHLHDQLTPVDEGTWHAAYWAAQTAMTGASLIRNGETRSTPYAVPQATMRAPISQPVQHI